jgi:hypothetical protein
MNERPEYKFIQSDRPASQPSIGRTVHFVLENGEHRPAIITRVPGMVLENDEDIAPEDVPTLVEAHPNSGVVALSAFLTIGDVENGALASCVDEGATMPVFQAPGSPYDPSGTVPYTWHWPEPSPPNLLHSDAMFPSLLDGKCRNQVEGEGS